MSRTHPATLGLLALCALAACAATPGGSSREAASGDVCADVALDAQTRSFALPGEIPIWRISNVGPDRVVILAEGDPAFAAPVVPDAAGKGMLFAGDAAFRYVVALETGASAAQLKVCWPDA